MVCIGKDTSYIRIGYILAKSSFKGNNGKTIVSLDASDKS